MNLVIRPVHDIFLEEVVFPAFALGVVDAGSGLAKLLESVADERVAWLLGRVLDRTVGGSFFGLVDDEWLELMHVLLFSEWERRRDGWHVAREHAGYAANYELALHVALMLQDPSYPYADGRAAEASATSGWGRSSGAARSRWWPASGTRSPRSRPTRSW